MVKGVIIFLYLFVCVRKWQCNDLKSKQRMCLCVDRLLHLAILAPLPFTQSWLVGFRPIRGQGHWIFCKITKWQRLIHKRLLLDSDQCQRAHTYLNLWFREIFILNFAPICLIVHIQEEYCAKLGGGMRHRSQKGDTNEADEVEIGQGLGRR